MYYSTWWVKIAKISETKNLSWANTNYTIIGIGDQIKALLTEHCYYALRYLEMWFALYVFFSVNFGHSIQRILKF